MITPVDDLDMAGVITASESSWIAPSSRLSPRAFGKLVTVLRREGADAVRKGQPWSLPLEDRALLVVAYWRTNKSRHCTPVRTRCRIPSITCR